MSSIKDEIDWEWPGDQTSQAQTNYFWQGVVREYLEYHVFKTVALICHWQPRHLAEQLKKDLQIHQTTTTNTL